MDSSFLTFKQELGPCDCSKSVLVFCIVNLFSVRGWLQTTDGENYWNFKCVTHFGKVIQVTEKGL